MPRGRKKDMTIPQTRALTTQRAYRARKAQYLSELEERCRIAEDENSRLRSELAAARADAETSATARERHTAEAAHELMQTLTAAQLALSRFQRVAFPRGTIPLHDFGPPTEGVPWPAAPSSASPQASTNSTSSSLSQMQSNHSTRHHHHHHPHHAASLPPLQTWRHHTTSAPNSYVQSPPQSLTVGAARLSIASLIEPRAHDDHRRHSHSGERTLFVASSQPPAPARRQSSVVPNYVSGPYHMDDMNGELMASDGDEDEEEEEEDQLREGSAEFDSNDEECCNNVATHTPIPQLQ